MLFEKPTDEELDLVIRYLNEDNTGKEEKSSFPMNAARKLWAMSDALRKRAADELVRANRIVTRLEKKVEVMSRKRDEQAVAGDFQCLGIDSSDLFSALVWLIQKCNYRCSKVMVNAILFECYAAWLVSHRQRLTVEEPKTSEFAGPIFWSAYHSVHSTGSIISEDVYNSIKSRNLGVAMLLKNAAIKYGKYTEKEMLRYVRGCDAFKDALPSAKNGNKWSQPLDDGLIWLWKDRQKDKDR